MRQVREVLRLKAAGIYGNEIARRVGVAPSTVRLTLLGAARRCRAELATAGRADRRGIGSTALYRRRQETGSSPPRRAPLGSSPPRAEEHALTRQIRGTSTSSKTRRDDERLVHNHRNWHSATG